MYIYFSLKAVCIMFQPAEINAGIKENQNHNIKERD